MKKISTVLLICISAICDAQSSKKISVINTLHIASAGGWDYLTIGPVNDRLYVSHGGQVNILNKNTGDSAGVIENTTGVHGIAFDVKNKKGFTSNGRLNSVTVFDMNTNKILTQIPTGANPDAIMYEPFTRMIIICNGRGKSLSFIDPATNTVKDSIDLGGKPETAVSDEKGKLYVNIEDKNEIAVIDLAQRKVTDRWSLAPGDGPSGLAIDIKTMRLFSTCDKLLIIMNADNGKIVDKLPIGDGCDGAAFDSQRKNIYTSNGDGTMTVIHESNANKFEVTDNVITKKSARTIALDNATHRLYLPAAEFEPQAPGEKGRPKMKPGTFQVLVVAYDK
jgi:DNA-binding beta-propeller fold protein YncE